MKYIQRQIGKKLLSLINIFPSIAITGPRQSGKSTLLIESLKDYRYVTFDDPLTREQALSDPQLFLDMIGQKTVLDEIQMAPGLLSYIKMRIDRNRDRKGIFVFTGSQQFNMIKNLGDSLAGRIALLDLLPFSVDEKKDAIKLDGTLEYFTHACLRGSYPELVVDDSIDSSAWYGSYIQTYLERDVRSIYNIGNLRDFQRFLQLLASRCSQILNLSQFANDLGISVPTVRNWLSILEASRIIYLLPAYYNNLGKRVTKSPKIYFLDVGLVCYLIGIKDKDYLLRGPMAGPLFENFCLQEIIKLFFHSGEQPRLYYLRTNNNLEIDLLIEESFQRLVPVEIKLSKTPTLSMASNISRFKKIFSQFDIKPGMIVSLSEKTQVLTGDVSVVAFDDFIKSIFRLLIHKEK